MTSKFMPSLFTHLNFIEEEYNSNPRLKNLNLELLKLGSIIPDIDYFVPKRKIKAFHFMHYNYELGVAFGKEMLNLAKTRDEVSFAIGFLSHVILDKEVHMYLEKETSPEEHFVIESYIDARHLYYTFPKGVFQKDLFSRLINLKHKNYKSDVRGVNWFHLLFYKFAFFCYKSLIFKHFLRTKAKWYNSWFAIFAENKKLQKVKIKQILNGRINQEKINTIEEKIKKAKIIFENEINTYLKTKGKNIGFIK